MTSLPNRAQLRLPPMIPAVVLLALLAPSAAAQPKNVHEQLLDQAARMEGQRRARFAAVRTPTELAALQSSLRAKFVELIGGLPQSKGPPPVRVTGKIEADDYVIEKLVFESFPGYFVSALLYKPKKQSGPAPGIVSPCGHSAVGKAAATYQTLHINLVKRGYVVLTYDPVGQGERSQFWDTPPSPPSEGGARGGKSRFNLTCGEHAVLGNPLYLLGTSLARYRIHDGVRAIDYLCSLPEVDARRIGCVGNSGGGTLTAYIAALDPRVKAAAIGCYITTLPRRMGNRIQTDPDADPEQDIFDFVGAGIDHAGLLALRAPRPTLLASARFDFFPIEGARESFAEAQKLFAVAGAPKAVEMVEAAEKHGLSLTLRKGVYAFFERHLAGRKIEGELDEIPVKPRPTAELLVCKEGQVNLTFRSRHLLTLAWEEHVGQAFQPDPVGTKSQAKKSQAGKPDLRKVLRLDPEHADYRLTEIAKGKKTLVLCVNGNETPPWQEAKELVAALAKAGHAVMALDPRGVGALRPDLKVRGRDYADPLAGVEENLAYNAFLVGKSLVGMRVTDVQAALKKLKSIGEYERIVLVGRRDSALVALMAAALDRDVTHLAVEDMPASYRAYFDPAGRAINAASIVPNLLRDHGDLGDVLAALAPRRVLATGNQQAVAGITQNPAALLDLLAR